MMTNSSASAVPKPQKYLFDAEFDYSETLEDIQSITPKELAEEKTKAQATSYEEGYQKGVQETNESLTRTASDQLFVITGKIDELIETEKMILNTFHTQVAQVSEMVTSMVLPALAKQGAIDEVKALLDKVKSQLPNDQKVTIFVQEPLVDLIKEHIAKGTSDADFTAEITVVAGSDFQPTDCKVSWEGAGIEHYMSNAMAEVRETLLRLGGKVLEIPQEDAVAKAAESIENETEEIPESTEIKDQEAMPQDNMND